RTHRPRHIERTGADAALLPAPEDERIDPDAAADDQTAHALRPVQLVRGERGEAHAGQIEGDLARGLRDVTVKQDVALRANRGDLRDRLDRADLAVRGLDGDEARVRPQRVTYLGRVDEAVLVRLQDGDVGDALRRNENRLVLHGAGDEVLARPDDVQRD